MPRDEQTRRILQEIERGGGLSHRTIAAHAGLSLGLTNELLQDLVRRRFVGVRRPSPERPRYEITPSGRRELARTSHAHLLSAINCYADARARVRQRLLELSDTWPPDSQDKRVVFFGAGPLAEIASACVAEAGLRVVGIVDDMTTEQLTSMDASGETFDRVVVTSLLESGAIRSRLDGLGICPTRVVWL
jgi:DNA-binding PadR family transcriptional regulator